MLKKYKWILLAFLFIFAVFFAFQVPWNSSIERALLQHVDFEAENVPRTESGLINFAEILDGSLKAPPENNMAFDFAKLLGTEANPPDVQFLEMLGNPKLDPDNYILEFFDYVQQNHPELTEDEQFEMDDRLYKPWKEADEAIGAEWIAKYSEQIDELVSASRKLSYYSPIYLKGGAENLLSVNLMEVLKSRSAARILRVRCNSHIGSGAIDEAVTDFLANYRIGAAVQTDGMFIDQLVGIAIISIGFGAVGDLLSSENLTQEHCNRLRREFRQPAGNQLARAADLAERWFANDTFQSLSRGLGREIFESNFLQDENRVMLFLCNVPSAVDWEVAADECNRWYDKLVVALAIEDDTIRRQELEIIDSEIKEMVAELENSAYISLRIVAGARSRGVVAGQSVAHAFFSSASSIDAATTRQKVSFDVAEVAFAIELFHFSKGSYPQMLDELVPDYLDKVPNDRFANQPLNYRKTETHYFIASIGQDQIDSFDKAISYATEEDEGFEHVDDTYTMLKVRLKK